MSKPIKITGYLIIELEDQLTAREAICELIENAGAANATTIDIVYTQRMFSICDNGDGTEDPNLIATPSQSKSRYSRSAIGSKGIGAKQACATFGRMWNIETVPRGQNQYHHYKVKWNEDGPLPNQYEGRGRPAHAAPEEIRNGGTKITVTNRRDGFPTLKFDSICRTLEEIYRPYLHSGEIKITIRNPDTGYVHQLCNTAYDRQLFAGPIKESNGSAAGHAFCVRYGVLKEHHRILSGCHLIFGPRVVKTLDSIGKYGLPSGCYVDVILSGDWKQSLATNKNNLARYEDDLIAELERLLGDWIAKQKEEATSYRLQLLSGAITDLINEPLSFLEPGRDGIFQAQQAKKRVENNEDDDEEWIPRKRRKHKRRRRAIVGGHSIAAHEPQRTCTRIKLDWDDKLVFDLFRVTYSSTTREVEVQLNVSKHQREIAEYRRKEKIDDLHKIVVLAFATYVAENRSSFQSVFRGLRARGYPIDEEGRTSSIINMVANFLIDAAFGRRGSIKKLVA